MSTWRTAKSLTTLLAEVNAAAPNRNKRNDGTIGDAAHAARASRHNPNASGVVTALDITHDPANGMDVHALVRRMTEGGREPHPDCAYIISNRQVARRSSGWVWKEYRGSHPHDQHAHFAVGTGADSNPLPPYDDTTSWHVAALIDPTSPWEEEDDMAISKVDAANAKKELTRLVQAGIITKPEARALDDAASVGLLWVIAGRLLDKLGEGR